MALIDLKTNLKSLKYGEANIAGGGGTPYVQAPMPNESNSDRYGGITDPRFLQLYRAGALTTDFPIRGGQLITTDVGYSTPAGQIDRSRIESFLKSPKGNIFVQKQSALQFANPKLQVGGGINLTGDETSRGIIENTRIYNGGRNTLLQVESQGTGVHFNRHGAQPTESQRLTYYYTAAATNTPNKNRLTLLRDTKLMSGTRTTYDYSLDSTILGTNYLELSRLGISSNKRTLFSYAGGPGASQGYGIGITQINRVDDTTPDKKFATTSYTYDQIANATTGRVRPHDFREDLERGQVMTSKYETLGIQTRLNTGNPGATFSRVDYRVTNSQAQDILNTLNVFSFDPTTKAPWEENASTKDMVKFVFECLSNDSTTQATALFFRAFLSTITDTNQADLGSFKYFGRGETFRTYKGFDRSISFGFKVAPQTRAELKPLYTKLNYLISQVYPDYSLQSGLMRGPVIQLTIGDYLYRVPGYLGNISITIDGATTPWEIVLDDTETDVQQLPQVLDIQCTFYPIHSFLPKRSVGVGTQSPIITAGGAFLNTPQPTTIEAPTQQAATQATITPSPAPIGFTDFNQRDTTGSPFAN